MKSVKITYLTSFICGIILFVIGFTLIFSIRNTPEVDSAVKTPAGNTDKPVNFLENYTGSKDPINLLVLIKEASGLHTDTIIIANYSPVTRQINLLTIPRDTKANNTSDIKINNIYEIGLNKTKDASKAENKHKALEYTAQTISNLTDISINYYVYLDIDTIKAIVDKLGGVYFDVPAKLRYSDPVQKLYIDLEKGYQLLDGDKTEQLLRFRKEQRRYYTSEELKELKKYYDGSDLKRTEMQLKFVNALIDQKVNLLQLPNLIPIVGYTFENVITNTELNDVLSLVSAFTQGSRPGMNTFKLYGIDKRIAGADFFIYNQTVEDTGSRKIIRAREVIASYFSIASAEFTPDPGKRYDFNTANWDNPSNDQSDAAGDNTDKP
ncbi:putative transcriptional regulator YvhJ [Ruminiclostridium hungatei]|uniref:Putative transcriptional regulator YvhJ n=1 Tax=Ruminiclostridium hungatei TaxID=48256 RepID=A0A1V4SJK0_RUMHU|nr:LCP family protein [Ruminiclostridium hungatei]OPX43676.1 putative transcriptional regulator YvhJ [Ruminiclostridium hungatei]